MKAIICPKGGPPEVLQLREVEKPAPREREVLIRIAATTVTAGDVILRRMSGPLRFIFGLAFGLGRDKVLGHELSGEIEAVGKGVSQFAAGDPVFASTGNRGGAYAEYICLSEDGLLARKPSNMTYEEAAAVPVGGITALCILRKVPIQRGQKVLIYGASGSVGTYAVQLARYFGAEVTGVCSSANLDLVKSLGADRVIDYTKGDFATDVEALDVIFDAVGKIPSSSSRRALKKQGALLSVKSSITETTEDLLFLRTLIEAGEVGAVIDRVYPLDEIADAHRYVEKGHKKGNVVISVRPKSPGTQSDVP